MSLEDLANLGEAVGGIAVLVSLIYLALQIRQNTRAIRASAYQQIVDSFSTISLEISKDPSLTEIFIRAQDGLAGFDDVERRRLELLMISFWRRAENLFFQSQQGTVLDEDWAGVRESLAIILQSRGQREMWTAIRGRFNPGFVSFVDAKLMLDQ